MIRSLTEGAHAFNVDGAASSLDEVGFVQRDEAGEGLWQPHDTYTNTQNGTTYLCAQNVTTLGEFGLGGAEMAFVSLWVANGIRRPFEAFDLRRGLCVEARYIPTTAGMPSMKF